MSISFGGSSNSSTSKNTQTPNPITTGLFDPTFSTVTGLVGNSTPAYTGQLYPGLSAGQTQAAGMANANIGLGSSAVQSGVNAATGLTGFDASQVYAPTDTAASAGNAALTGSNGYTAQNAGAASAGPASLTAGSQIDPSMVNQVASQGLTGVDLSQYIDPNVAATLTPTLALLQQQEGQTIAQQQGQFTQAGAFGGSREGVADSLTNQAYANTEAQTIANAESTAYTNAAANAETDLSRGLQAGESNQATDLSAGTANANLGETTGLTNAAAQNAMAQYNAANQETTGLANQSAQNTAGQFGAAASNTADLSNQAAQNAMAQYNAAMQQQSGLANQSTNLAAQTSNQNAGIASAGINLNAAGLAGQLGQTQQNMGLADTNAIDQLGTQAQQTQAAQDAAQWQQYLLGLQYPLSQASSLEGLLGTLPTLGTLESTTGKSTGTQTGGGIGLNFAQQGTGGGSAASSLAAFGI